MGKHWFHKAILLALLLTTIGGAATPALASAASTPAQLTWLFGSGSATGGKIIHLRATLDRPAPAGGAVIKLTTTSPLIDPPATATVPAGETQVIVAIRSLAVHENTPVTLTATYRNRVRMHRTLILRPYLSSMTIQPEIQSGGTGLFTVRLSGIAPQGGITVFFKTSRPSLVPVPSAVHFPAGSASVTYVATGRVVNRDIALNVTSKHRGITIRKPTILRRTLFETQTPPPTATATATIEPTKELASPTATATATTEPTATATATDEPTATATATDEPTATATATDEPTATATETNVPTATATATDEPTATATATDEPTATSTATDVPTATATATDVPTATATATDESTATATATNEPTATATATNEPTATATATDVPTATATATVQEANPVVVMCHMVGDGTYNLLAPHASGIVNGHIGEDTGDIIPPFEYQGVTYVQNWDEASQAIFTNGCVVPTAALNRATLGGGQESTGVQGEEAGGEQVTYGVSVTSESLSVPRGGTVWFTVCLSQPAASAVTMQWYPGQTTFDAASNSGAYTFAAGEQCLDVAFNGLNQAGGTPNGTGTLIFALDDGQLFTSPEVTFKGK